MRSATSFRKQILKILPKSYLETLVDNKRRPWDWSRPDLESLILTTWNEDTDAAVLKFCERYLKPVTTKEVA